MANWNGQPQFMGNEYIPRSVWQPQRQVCPGVTTNVPVCGPYILPPQSPLFRFPGSNMYCHRDINASGQFITTPVFQTFPENHNLDLPLCTDSVIEANVLPAKEDNASLSGGGASCPLPLEKYLDLSSLSLDAARNTDLEHETFMQYSNAPFLHYYNGPDRNISQERNFACTEIGKCESVRDPMKNSWGSMGMKDGLQDMPDMKKGNVGPVIPGILKIEESMQPTMQPVPYQGVRHDQTANKRGKGQAPNLPFNRRTRNMMQNPKENSTNDMRKEQVRKIPNEKSWNWKSVGFTRDGINGKQKNIRNGGKFNDKSLLEEEKTLGRKKLLAEAGMIIQSMRNDGGPNKENSLLQAGDEQLVTVCTTQQDPNPSRYDKNNPEFQMNIKSKGFNGRKKVDKPVSSPDEVYQGRMYYNKSFIEKKNQTKLKQSNRGDLRNHTNNHTKTVENNFAVKNVDEQNQSFVKEEFREKEVLSRDKENYKVDENVKAVWKVDTWERNSDSEYMQNNKETFLHNRGGGSNSNAVQANMENDQDCKSTSDLRERLIEQLTRGCYECMVCCDRVRQHNAVWSCSVCYQLFHIHCIKKWAKSSQGDGSWRCPGCQNLSDAFPSVYHCFCRKLQNPEWNRGITPHSCGEVCEKTRTEKNCPHKCLLLCHPGPCPPCDAQVTRSCPCGKTTHSVKCSRVQPVLCGQVCEKTLNCGIHSCKKLCHSGPCGDCEVKVKQDCYCGKCSRVLQCLPSTTGIAEYSCGKSCGKMLTCNNHHCENICHAGACDLCPLSVDVSLCPCGQTELEKLYERDGVKPRTSCLDEIPTCGNLCSKQLSCGPSGNGHVCQSPCHSGPCPICPLTTVVKCRCGTTDKEILCADLKTKGDDTRCDKRCRKKRACGRHKCSQFCCVDQEHNCPLVCGRNLRCGLHKCDEPCHRETCPPCWRTSFDELYCYCGKSVLYPPIPCGTKPPECPYPCTRPQQCQHQVNHTCHSDGTCPPCTVLTEKWCYGNHELRKNIPCYLVEVSCGLLCNKPLSCGQHKCTKTCHPGDCLKEGTPCTQACTKPREECGHICAATCHTGKCPDSPCKEKVKVTCACGHLAQAMNCSENDKEYKRVATSLLASKMANMQAGHSMDLSDVFCNSSNKKVKYKRLECNEECALIDRNRRVALALQIQNPELSNKLGPPKYSAFMKEWAKKDPQFTEMVHDKLSKLVQLAKESKQKSRSHSFDCMNRDKRQLIHEYCEYFGCESVSYDQEPKRNVVATAVKDKSWLPSMSILEVVQREMGHRKVPAPIWSTENAQKSLMRPILQVVSSHPEKTASSCTGSYANSVSGHENKSKDHQEKPEIDYFDYNN